MPIIPKKCNGLFIYLLVNNIVNKSKKPWYKRLVPYLVVPYDYGLPFTINIALPIVYGSSQIYNRLNSLNIESEIYIEENEGHEYWGALNGNWFGGRG